MRTILHAAAIASLWLPSTLAQSEEVECVDGLYMIVARGTTEPQGPGDLGRIAKRLSDRIEGSAIHSVVYPATYTDPYHVDSIKNGSNAAREAITNYAKQCPDGKMALLGYSQGAQVIGNSICGDTGGWLNDTVNADHPIFKALFAQQDGHLAFEDGPGVDEDLVSGKIISVLLFGDPTFGAETTFSEGTGSSDGLWPRDWASCDGYSSLTQSYCDEGDIICDARSEYIDGVHVQYTHRYGEEAVEFALERWNEATGGKVEVDAGGPFPLFDDGGAGGNSSTPTPTTIQPTSSPTGSPTEDAETTPTAGASGLQVSGSLMIATPLMLLASWFLA